MNFSLTTFDFEPTGRTGQQPYLCHDWSFMGQWFDFRAYQIWKVSDWTRPVGAGGPAEDDWTLLAEYRLFSPQSVRIHWLDAAAFIAIGGAWLFLFFRRLSRRPILMSIFMSA